MWIKIGLYICSFGVIIFTALDVYYTGIQHQKDKQDLIQATKNISTSLIGKQIYFDISYRILKSSIDDISKLENIFNFFIGEYKYELAIFNSKVDGISAYYRGNHKAYNKNDNYFTNFNSYYVLPINQDADFIEIVATHHFEVVQLNGLNNLLEGDRFRITKMINPKESQFQLLDKDLKFKINGASLRLEGENKNLKSKEVSYHPSGLYMMFNFELNEK